MYKSIPENLPIQDLTTVIHFAVKMLNKFKNLENREIKLDQLPVNPGEELLPICNNLLKEIDIEKLKGNNVELDKHIKLLYEILEIRLKSEPRKTKNNASSLLAKFRTTE